MFLRFPIIHIRLTFEWKVNFAKLLRCTLHIATFNSLNHSLTQTNRLSCSSFLHNDPFVPPRTCVRFFYFSFFASPYPNIPSPNMQPPANMLTLEPRTIVVVIVEHSSPISISRPFVRCTRVLRLACLLSFTFPHIASPPHQKNRHRAPQRHRST